MLKADLDAPHKQRHTVTRIWHRLIDEHGMDDVSYPVVQACIAERKPQIRADASRGPAEMFLWQPHRPGDEAEVDFGEVVVRLEGDPTTLARRSRPTSATPPTTSTRSAPTSIASPSSSAATTASSSSAKTRLTAAPPRSPLRLAASGPARPGSRHFGVQ